MANELYIPGALYIAGFTQARSPHIGVLLANSPSEGTLFHIRIDRTTSPNWKFQCRKQSVVGDMFLSSLLRVSEGPLVHDNSEAMLKSVAIEIPPPPNDLFGECAPWAFSFLERLHSKQVVNLIDKEKLAEEVDSFSRGSRAFARRDKFPNVAISCYCK